MILAAAAMGEAASPRSETAASVTPLRVSVLLSTYAGLDPTVVESGKVIAERIYREVGVELVWFGGGDLAAQLPQDRKARDAFYESTLKVLVVARREFRADALAEAVREARMAWVSMARLDREVDKHPGLSLGDILGHVIAHEIGHLLGQGHCAMGLMAPRMQWHRVSQGGLWFVGRQGAGIREQVSADASLAPPEPAPHVVAMRAATRRSGPAGPLPAVRRAARHQRPPARLTEGVDRVSSSGW